MQISVIEVRNCLPTKLCYQRMTVRVINMVVLCWSEWEEACCFGSFGWKNQFSFVQAATTFFFSKNGCPKWSAVHSFLLQMKDCMPYHKHTHLVWQSTFTEWVNINISLHSSALFSHFLSHSPLCLSLSPSSFLAISFFPSPSLFLTPVSFSVFFTSPCLPPSKCSISQFLSLYICSRSLQTEVNSCYWIANIFLQASLLMQTPVAGKAVWRLLW